MSQLAPFEGGIDLDDEQATNGDYLLVATISDDSTGGSVQGIAVNDSALYVCDTANNLIHVYDSLTLRPISEWAVPYCDEMVLDSDGSLWIIHPAHNNMTASIQQYTPDGTPTNKTIINLDIPTALAFDPQGRLYIAENGQRQQILIYDVAQSPTFIGTFGAENGIYSGVAGQVAPLKFYDLQGVGVDEQGNIYVGMGSEQSGTHLQSYTPNGTLRWEIYSLFFVDSVGIDATSNGDIVYGKHERFTLDYANTEPGTEASYVAYTLNPFKYPHDMRLQNYPTDVFTRSINGATFLYMTDMYSSYLAVYRFNFATDGEIAIPSALFVKEPFGENSIAIDEPASAWIWRDTDGDGNFDTNEYDSQTGEQDSVYAWGWWVDSAGTVWRANREQGIRSFPLQGIDAHGNPIYSYQSSINESNPIPFDNMGDINRIFYYPETDTMVLTGYTTDYPNEYEHWGNMGRIVVGYVGWSIGNRTPTWQITPHWSNEEPPIGMDITDNYLFLGYTHPEPAHVRVYARENGAEVGILSPDDTVGNFSGWFDIRHPIRAIQRPDGEYIIFAEEDGRGKNIIYRWKSE